MARVCSLTGKRVQFGNNRSHAMNKTRRRFNANIQTTGLYSDALKGMVRVKLSTAALRSVEHRGGIDAFLLSSRDADLTQEARTLKRRIKRALSQADTKAAS